MRRLLTLLALLVTLTLAGCATDQRNQALSTTLLHYANTVRWGDFQQAMQYIDPKELQEHPPTSLELSRFAQYRVSGYEEGQGPMPNGENEVRQLVQISLINVNTQAERTVLDRQTWRYDPEKKRWYLMSGLPKLDNE
jgi:hypothetical protein